MTLIRSSRLAGLDASPTGEDADRYSAHWCESQLVDIGHHEYPPFGVSAAGPIPSVLPSPQTRPPAHLIMPLWHSPASGESSPL